MIAADPRMGASLHQGQPTVTQVFLVLRDKPEAHSHGALGTSRGKIQPCEACASTLTSPSIAAVPNETGK